MYAFIHVFVYTCNRCRCDEQSGNEMNKGDEESSNYTDVSILSMRGGDGHNSYATNSLLQVLSSSIYIYIYIYISFSLIFVRHKHKLIFHHIFYTPTSYRLHKLCM